MGSSHLDEPISFMRWALFLFEQRGERNDAARGAGRARSKLRVVRRRGALEARGDALRHARVAGVVVRRLGERDAATGLEEQAHFYELLTALRAAHADGRRAG